MVEIDKYAGFCFGVTKAIKSAEAELSTYNSAFCLGKIVHNQKEESRLQGLGLHTIDYAKMQTFPPKRLLIRAHGEPPATYLKAKDLGITLIDETCPVVLKLQQLIAKFYHENKDWQIVIFGKKGHAEVNGLVGQTDGQAIVISSLAEVNAIDFSQPLALFSQTTADIEEFKQVANEMQKQTSNLQIFETICQSVKNRIPRLREFCSQHEVIIFVSDSASSNGKMLFDVCKTTNSLSYFVTDSDDIQSEWLQNVSDIGVSGANSTPLWLLEIVKDRCNFLIKNQDETV